MTTPKLYMKTVVPIQYEKLHQGDLY